MQYTSDFYSVLECVMYFAINFVIVIVWYNLKHEHKASNNFFQNSQNFLWFFPFFFWAIDALIRLLLTLHQVNAVFTRLHSYLINTLAETCMITWILGQNKVEHGLRQAVLFPADLGIKSTRNLECSTGNPVDLSHTFVAI
jgi:hypothetical protein